MRYLVNFANADWDDKIQRAECKLHIKCIDGIQRRFKTPDETIFTAATHATNQILRNSKQSNFYSECPSIIEQLSNENCLNVS